jgi:5-methylcytosine-specific restriction endonuclease McrA
MANTSETNILMFRNGCSAGPDIAEIRREVIARDHDQCMICRAPDGTSVARVDSEHFQTYVILDTRESYDATDGTYLGTVPDDVVIPGKRTRIVLDLAYVDGNPANIGTPGDRENVFAACQACHKRINEMIWQKEALARAKAKEREARIAKFGPTLPGFEDLDFDMEGHR